MDCRHSFILNLKVKNSTKNVQTLRVYTVLTVTTGVSQTGNNCDRNVTDDET